MAASEQEDLSVHSPYYKGLPRPMVIMAGYIEADFIVPYHKHPYGQLVYASDGLVSVTTPSGGYIVPPQRAVWIPPHFEHGVSFLQSAEFATVFIEEEPAESMPDDYCVLAVSELSRQLILKASGFADDYDWQGAEGRVFRTLRDQLLDAEIIDCYLPMPSDKRLIQLANSLQANPADNRSLEEWGSLVGASSRTLARLFVKETGIGFSHWKQRLRIQQAMLLLSKSLPVSTVAAEVGYESASSFIAVFQKVMGITPGGYTKATREC